MLLPPDGIRLPHPSGEAGAPSNREEGELQAPGPGDLSQKCHLGGLVSQAPAGGLEGWASPGRGLSGRGSAAPTQDRVEGWSSPPRVRTPAWTPVTSPLSTGLSLSQGGESPTLQGRRSFQARHLFPALLTALLPPSRGQLWLSLPGSAEAPALAQGGVGWRLQGGDRSCLCPLAGIQEIKVKEGRSRQGQWVWPARASGPQRPGGPRSMWSGREEQRGK